MSQTNEPAAPPQSPDPSAVPPNPAAGLSGPASPTSKDLFEHMLLYCLTSLQRAGKKGICAFYIEDFPDCDELTLKAIQKLVSTRACMTKDYLDPQTQQYKGFWAWPRHTQLIPKADGDPGSPGGSPASPSPPKITDF